MVAGTVVSSDLSMRLLCALLCPSIGVAFYCICISAYVHDNVPIIPMRGFIIYWAPGKEGFNATVSRHWKGHNSGSKASPDTIPRPFDVK